MAYSTFLGHMVEELWVCWIFIFQFYKYKCLITVSGIYWEGGQQKAKAETARAYAAQDGKDGYWLSGQFVPILTITFPFFSLRECIL